MPNKTTIFPSWDGQDMYNAAGVFIRCIETVSVHILCLSIMPDVQGMYTLLLFPTS